MSFEEIIDKVKTRPEIWQRAHPLYKCKVLRLKIWHQISKELKTDAQQLKKSWKYLNDQYRREYKKMKSLAAQYTGKPIPCGWAYYDQLSFLMPEMALRKDRQPTRALASSDSDTGANDSTMTQDFPAMTQETFHEEDNDDTTYNYENGTRKYNAAVKQAQQPKLGPSNSSGVTKADLILRRLQSLNAAVARSQVEATKNDEDYLFLMSILPMVRNLSPVKKLQLRGKINEWLLQALSGETDPLNNVQQYVVPLEESCEDDKDAVMKQIMAAEDDD